MNQILFVQEKKRINPQDTKNIVLFFAISIIVFGLIMFVQGVYGVHVYNENKEIKQTQEDKTQIQLSQTDDGNVLITVESQTAIAEIIYFWNSDASQTISQDGRTTIQERITMPVGENTLTVKTIDVNGYEQIEQGTFILNVDKPVINLSSVVGNNLKISVESKVEISYVTYKWNTEEEKKFDMLTFADKTKFEKEIEIKVGQNTLLVTAVDIYGNKSEKSQQIKGLSLPEILPSVQGENIVLQVISQDDKITQVEYEFNGTTGMISKEQLEQSGQTNRVTYSFKIQEGLNYLKVKVTTENGMVKEYVGKHNK